MTAHFAKLSKDLAKSSPEFKGVSAKHLAADGAGLSEAQNKLWHGKPYYSLDAYCKNTYGEKLFKIALNAGLSCPNRDGTLDTHGCIFCSRGGSGDFALPLQPGSFQEHFHETFERGKNFSSGKKTGQRFIAYFQAYTNTYGPPDYLERIYRLALEEPSVAGISIATRPDCLPEDILSLLIKLKKEYASKFIWIELGLQTIHEKTAAFIRRGYFLPCFESAVRRLSDAGFSVIVHVILGLPGETPADMLSTIDYLNRQPILGIKLQLLHILRETELGSLYLQDPDACGSFGTLTLYLNALISCLELLRPDIVVHRVTGDAPKELLLYPLWSADKRRVLNTLHKQMAAGSHFQGRLFVPECHK